MNSKYLYSLIICMNFFIVGIVQAQLKVGVNIKTISSNTNFEIESTTGSKIVVRKDSAMMGINNTNPKNKLEVTHGINGNSGLRFTNLTNTSSGVSSNSVNQKFLSVNSSGDVVLANAVDQIISVSGLSSNLVSPISAATFQAGTFENSFSKVDSTVLYLNQTDGTTWVYTAANGGQYRSYVAPASTAWFLNNSTTDAGNNKTSGIARAGFVTIGATAALNTNSPLNIISPSSGAYTSVGCFYAPNNGVVGNATQLNFGAVNTVGNNAEWRFLYQGNNVATNRVDFGMSGYNSPMISYLVNGNVGVGNASPSYKLDVAGKGRFTDTLFGTKAQFNNLASGVSTDSIITIDASGNLKKRNANSLENNWLKKTQNTAASSNTDTIYQMGNVGIQTSTPTFPLEVMGTNTLDGVAIGNSSLGSSYRSKISSQGSGSNDRWMKFNADWNSTTNNTRAFGFFRGTNEYLTILDNGNMGVGNASPSYKLDVAGKGRFTDTLFGTKAQFNNLASGATTDSIVTIDASGNLKKRNANTLMNNWFSKTTNTSATSNTDTIYQMGNVGIGTTTPSEQLTVSSATNPSEVGVYSGVALPAASDIVTSQIKMGPSKNWYTSIRNVLPMGSIGTDVSDLQFTTGQASNNNTQVPRIVVKATTGNVGIGTTTPIGLLSNHSTNILATNGQGVVGNNFSWSSSLGGTVATIWNTGVQTNATTLLVGSSGTSTNNLFEVSTGTAGSVPTKNIFSIKGNANVGVHKYTPSQQFQIGNNGNVTANKIYNGSADEGLSLVHYINTSNENNNTYTRVADIVVASPTTASAGAGVLRFLTSTNAEAGGNIVEKMRIHSNGFVGIGTASPSTLLHVNNPLPATATVNADAQILRLSRPVTTNIKWDNIAQFNIGSYSTIVNANTRLDLALNDGAGLSTSNIMTWQGNGNVGIGTTAPANKLEISQGTAGNSGLRFTNLLNSNTALSASAVNQKYLSVNSAGDVVLAAVADPVISVTGLASGLVSPVAAATFQGGTFENSYTKTDSTVIYVNQTDGTQWIYSATGGGVYKSYVAPASTEWYTAGSTTDAGSNKTGSIYRTGNVGIGNSTPLNKLVVKGLNNQPSALGAAQTNAIFRVEGESNHALDIGTYTNSPYGAYIQVQNKTATNGLPLTLNPVGGNVGVGTNTPQSLLDVTASTGSSTLTIGTTGATSTDQVSLNFGTKYDKVNTIGTSANLGWQFGARGYTWPSPQTNVLHASYWNGTGWYQAITIQPTGNFGIGTVNPGSKLEVNGSATNTTAYNAAAATTIDYSLSNLAYTSASAGAFTLTNIKDGGTYTLAVQGATAGTSSFTATGFTFKSINNGVTTASKHTLYTFVVMGTTVYYYMATGF